MSGGEIYSESDGFVKITFSGSGFGSSAELFLDGLEQEILSVSDTQIVAKVIDLLGTGASSIELYAEKGTPDGYNSVLTSLDLTQFIDLVSIDTIEGS